jgi:hypothetical protein
VLVDLVSRGGASQLAREASAACVAGSSGDCRAGWHHSRGLMRQVRRAADAGTSGRRKQSSRPAAAAVGAVASNPAATSRSDSRAKTAARRAAGREVWLDAWRWAQDNRAEDGSQPCGAEIARQFGRHERWGRLVKRSGLVGDLGT